jgi:hypothetical protein
MIIRRLLVALSLAGQTFVQMSDPQFGMFTKNASFEHETVNLNDEQKPASAEKWDTTPEVAGRSASRLCGSG